jgi:hypothetical protein
MTCWKYKISYQILLKFNQMPIVKPVTGIAALTIFLTMMLGIYCKSEITAMCLGVAIM